MACKFSCMLKYSNAFKENEIALFYSDDGDEYRVKYKSNVCRDLYLSIAWTTPKEVLVTAKLYSKTFKKCFCSKGSIVNGTKIFMKLRGAFNVCGSPDYNILCVINIIPYVMFKSSKQQSVALNDIPDKLESVMEISPERLVMDDKYKLDHSDKSVIINTVNEAMARDISEKSKDVAEIELQGSLTPKCNRASGDKFVLSSLEMKTVIDVADDDFEKIDTVLDDQTQNILMNEQSLTSDGMHDNLIRIPNINLVLENEITELSEDQNNFANSLDKEECNIRVQENHSTVPHNDISAEDRPQMGTDFQKVPDNNLTSDDSDDSDDIVACHGEDPVNKTVSNDVPERLDSAIETELRLSPTGKRKFLTSCDANNEVITNSNVEVYEAMPSSSDVVVKTDLPMSSKGRYDFMKNDPNSAIFSHTNTTVHELMPSDSIIRGTVKMMKNEFHCSTLDANVLCRSNDKNDAIKNNSGMNVHNSVPLMCFSEKTDLVSDTLVKRLCTDTCDIMSAKSGDEVANATEIKSGRGTGSKDPSAKMLPSIESALHGLSIDMLDLLMSGSMTDSTLSNGRKEVKVHKAIVSARSSVLKSIITNSTSETVEHRVIVDIPDHILEDLVVFIYVGLVNIRSLRMAEELYEIAERYCINDLRDICSKYISK